MSRCVYIEGPLCSKGPGGQQKVLPPQKGPSGLREVGGWE